jgi:hypothetical protein
LSGNEARPLVRARLARHRSARGDVTSALPGD